MEDLDDELSESNLSGILGSGDILRIEKGRLLCHLHYFTLKEMKIMR